MNSGIYELSKKKNTKKITDTLIKNRKLLAGFSFRLLQREIQIRKNEIYHSCIAHARPLSPRFHFYLSHITHYANNNFRKIHIYYALVEWQFSSIFFFSDVCVMKFIGKLCRFFVVVGWKKKRNIKPMRLIAEADASVRALRRQNQHWPSRTKDFLTRTRRIDGFLCIILKHMLNNIL